MLKYIALILAVGSAILQIVLFCKLTRISYSPMKPLLKLDYFIHEQSNSKYIFRKIIKIDLFSVTNDYIWDISASDCKYILPVHFYKEIIFNKNEYGWWSINYRILPTEHFEDTENRDHEKLIMRNLKPGVSNLSENEIRATLKIVKHLNSQTGIPDWI